MLICKSGIKIDDRGIIFNKLFVGVKKMNEFLNKYSDSVIPFPIEWIREHPSKVESVLEKLSLEDQIRCAMQLRGSSMQGFINLSKNAQAVIRGLPPEELYQMIKETGLAESLPVIEMMSQDQLQYSFDLEWWQRDRFVPECALEWIEILGACEDSSILEWLQNEEFEQKVVLFQSLIKVYKDDEMTNSYEGIEDMPHLNIDGVYDIYFKMKEHGAIRRLITMLRDEDQALYSSILEAVIWYPITQTIEKAYRWRLTRTAERGIPDFREAMGVYSYPSSEALTMPTPELEDFTYPGEFNIAPTYPLLQIGLVPFLKDVISHLGNSYRLNTICWEMIYLANKIMVADQMESSNLEMRNESLKKVMGYVNIGLELGASGELEKGAKLLNHTQMLPLFQTGYQQLMNLKWKAESFIKNNGNYLEWMFAETHKDLLAALLDRFPRVAEIDGDKESLSWRHFVSIQEVRKAEFFLDQWSFNLRFARQGFGLETQLMRQYLETCDVPEKHESVDLTVWTTMAFAHYILFKKISCEPLSEPAAKSFLEIIFLPGIFNEEVRQCDNALVESFYQELLKLPLAWIETDRIFLRSLLNDSTLRIQQEFGRIDLKGKIDWRFTHGLCIMKQNS